MRQAGGFAPGEETYMTEATDGFDLVIKAGRVVTPEGLRKVDIGVVGEKIAELGQHLSVGPGGRELRADGLLVIPGLVDVHVHLRDPGFPAKEDFHSGTCAAAASGVTTIIAQPNTRPAVTDAVTFGEVRRIGEEKAVVDFGISAMATEENTTEIPELVAAGAASIDLALGGSSPETIVSSNAALLDIFAQVKETATLATVFCADANVAGAAKARLQREGRQAGRCRVDRHRPCHSCRPCQRSQGSPTPYQLPRDAPTTAKGTGTAGF
jgi:dihydroorotase-like cyclic amidohydrolase